MHPGLNSIQTEILELSAEVVALLRSKASSEEVMLAALEVAAKVAWLPSPAARASEASDSSV